MSAAVAGTTRLRKATNSSRKPSATMTPMKSGSFEVMMAAKSSKMAVAPPTSTCRLLPFSAAGITSLRRWVMRSLVWTSWGEVVGMTSTMATFAPGWEGKGTTAATPGSLFRVSVNLARAALSAGEPICATSSSGPLKPGPKPWVSRS